MNSLDADLEAISEGIPWIAHGGPLNGIRVAFGAARLTCDGLVFLVDVRGVAAHERESWMLDKSKQVPYVFARVNLLVGLYALLWRPLAYKHPTFGWCQKEIVP